MALIGLDLDGTVADYNKLVHHIGYTNNLITSPNFIEPQTYDMVGNGWFDSFEQFLLAHRILCSEEDGIARLELLEEYTNNAIKEWQAAGHTVCAVTARKMPDHDEELRKKVITDTHNWVNLHLPALDDLVIVKSGEKSIINADIYIDDSPHELTNLASLGFNTLIRHQEYNKNIDGDRIFSLHEALPYINAVA